MIKSILHHVFNTMLRVPILKVNKKDDDIVSYLRTQKDEGQ